MRLFLPSFLHRTRTPWRKAQASTFNSSCVEVAALAGGDVGLRDTKARGLGPVLRISPEDFAALRDAIKTGDPDVVRRREDHQA